MPNDWEPFDEGGPTHPDGPAPITVTGAPALAHDPTTAKHNTVEFNVGREAGYTDGVERAITALRAELAGWTPEEVASLEFRLREATRRAG